MGIPASLHPNPCTPPALPVLLYSLWLHILLWQSLVCGARAETPSAPTPACLLTGGAQGLSGVNELFSASASLCAKRGESVPLVSEGKDNLKDILTPKFVIKELSFVGNP